MRQIVQTAQFKIDLKKVALSGRHHTGELFEIVAKLAKGDDPGRKVPRSQFRDSDS